MMLCITRQALRHTTDSMALCIMLEGTLPHHELGDGPLGTREFRIYWQENLERWEKDIFGFLRSHTSQFGSEKTTHIVSLPPHTRASNIELRTQACLGPSRQVTWARHSGIRGQVRTGTETACKLFASLTPSAASGAVFHHYGHGAVQVVFHRRAAPPHRPSLGHPLLPGLRVTVLTPQVVPTPGLDCSATLSLRVWTIWSTLPRRVRLLGLYGGRWEVTDGKAETAVTKRYFFLVKVLIVHWHFHGSHCAMLHHFKSGVRSSGKECGKHSGSASAR